MLISADQHHMFFERIHIMEGIKAYIISIVAAAVLIGVLSCFFRKGSIVTKPFMLITSVFMILSMFQPFIGFRIGGNSLEMAGLYDEAEDLIRDSVDHSREEMASIITDQVKTYIQNKASAMGLILQMEIILSEEDPPVPWSVHLWGSVSPREKEILETYIYDNLAIARERVFWN